jgi:hypothetical protein
MGQITFIWCLNNSQSPVLQYGLYSPYNSSYYDWPKILAETLSLVVAKAFDVSTRRAWWTEACSYKIEFEVSHLPTHRSTSSCVSRLHQLCIRGWSTAVRSYAPACANCCKIYCSCKRRIHLLKKKRALWLLLTSNCNLQQWSIAP